MNTRLMLIAASFAATANIVAVATAMAQDNTAVRNYDIPAGPLKSAINRVARVSGVAMSYDARLLAGKTSRAVKGRYRVVQALDLLLTGTGMRATSDGAGGFVLVAARTPEGARRPAARPMRSVNREERPSTAVTEQSDETDIIVTGFVSPSPYYQRNTSVSVGKSDQSLLETAQSVSVVSADQIKATGAISLSESLAFVPGVGAQSSLFSARNDEITLRGFTIADGYSGMLRDGLRLQPNQHGLAQEPYGLERIEIVRGAASALYGQLSPGGFVNAVSKRPTINTVRELRAGYGSFRNAHVAGDFGGSVNDDGSLSFRLTGLARTSDSWIDHHDDKRLFGGGGLTWAPQDDTAITVLANHHRSHTQYNPQLPYAIVEQRALSQSFYLGEPDFDRYDVSTTTAGLWLDHRFDPALRVRGGARYYRSDVRRQMLQFQSLNPAGMLSRSVDWRNEDAEALVADLSVEGKFALGAIEHTLLVGADHFSSDWISERYNGSVGPISVAAPVYGQAVTLNSSVDRGTLTKGRQTGAYAQDQIRLGNWLATLGLRFDHAVTRTEDFRTASRRQQSDDVVTGRASLLYLAGNGLAPYVSFSQSFNPATGVDRNGAAFMPMRAEQYEAGVRYEPPGTSLLFSAAAFQLTQTNVLSPDPVDPEFQIQMGEVRSRGIELEAKGQLRSLGIAASYAYTDAQITRNSDPTLIGVRSRGAYRHLVSLWADYSFSKLGLKGVRSGVGLRYVSSDSIPGFDRTVPGYALVNMMVAYDLGALSSQLRGASFLINASNLFDRDYFTCAGVANGCRYGAPRAVMATMTYGW